MKSIYWIILIVITTYSPFVYANHHENKNNQNGAPSAHHQNAVSPDLSTYIQDFDPTEEMIHLKEQLNTFLGDLHGRMSRSPYMGQLKWPKLDLQNTQKHFIVTVDLPGMSKEEINIEATENALTIFGERNRDPAFSEDTLYRAERKYGSFSRTLDLPEVVLIDKIEATYQNGILKIKLEKLNPQVSAPKVKKISIQ